MTDEAAVTDSATFKNPAEETTDMSGLDELLAAVRAEDWLTKKRGRKKKGALLPAPNQPSDRSRN